MNTAIPQKKMETQVRTGEVGGWDPFEESGDLTYPP
jgi:hypothetical protein